MAKFEKGKSGNPTGRKKGASNKRTQLAHMLEPHAKDLINKVIELALQGDINALKQCFDRLIPKMSNQTISFDVGELDIENLDNLSAIGKRVVALIAKGDMAVEDGQKLFNIFDAQRKLIEHVDMSKKIDEIIEYLPKF